MTALFAFVAILATSAVIFAIALIWSFEPSAFTRALGNRSAGQNRASGRFCSPHSGPLPNASRISNPAASGRKVGRPDARPSCTLSSPPGH